MKKFTVKPRAVTASVQSEMAQEDWNFVLSELEEGTNEDYIEGDAIGGIVQDVADNMGIYLEPSMQGPWGSMYLLDDATDEQLGRVSRDAWIIKCRGKAFAAKTEAEFRQKIANWFKEFQK